MKQFLFNRITVIMLTLFNMALFPNSLSYGQTTRLQLEGDAGWVESFGNFTNQWGDRNFNVLDGGAGRRPTAPGNSCPTGTDIRGRYILVSNLPAPVSSGGQYNITLGYYDLTNSGSGQIWFYIGPSSLAASISEPPTDPGGMDYVNSFSTVDGPHTVTANNVILGTTDAIYLFACASVNVENIALDFMDFTPGVNFNNPLIAPQTFSTSECSIAGTTVGTVAASDPDAGQTVTYSITGGNTGNMFAINSITGAITVTGILDFETTPSYSLTVQVDDNGTPVKTAFNTITVTILDCTNENDPTISNQFFSIDENSPASTVVGMVVASDVDAGQTLSYSITAGNIGNAFGINASTGAITIAAGAAIDYETTSVYSLTVQVTDNGTPIRNASATVTVNVNDVNENPNAPVIASGQVFSIAENSANGTAVGTVLASDADVGQTFTYMILTGNTGNAFAINSSTGQITVAGPIDFETLASYSILIRVFDNGTPARLVNGTITIKVTDVFDPNINTPVVNPQTFSVTENSAISTAVGTVVASDADTGQLLTYSITAGNTGSAFAINSSTGAITTSSSIDFETTSTYGLTVQACDNGGPIKCSSNTITVNVIDVPIELPPGAFVQRQTWDGPLGIKMIASANLDPVFVDPTKGSVLHADSLITTDIMRRTGNRGLHINNEYARQSPFTTISNIPMSAFLCSGNPNVGGCVAGLLTQTTNSSCNPVNGTVGPIAYNGPSTVSKLVSMTYADYDTDNSTFSSSMAELNVPSCSQIETAYLYWTGNLLAANPAITLEDGPLNTYTGPGNVFDANISNVATVKIKVPGSSTYQNVTALPANILTVNGNDGQANRFRCVADVTSLLQGVTSGQFWVADLRTYPNARGSAYGGSASGWTLVFVYRSPLNPQRTISLWDGLDNNNSTNTYRSYTLSGLVTPPSGTFNSYVGYGVLDAENTYAALMNPTQEGLRIESAGGTVPTNVTFNPFATDQPTYKLYNNKGYPAQCDGSDNKNACNAPLYNGNWCSVYDGVSSSHITSYNETTGKNANEIVRLPTNVNTLGYDSHHTRLPDNSISPGSTSATLSISSGPQGGVTSFFAYIAIESVLPNLTMTKVADKTTTGLSSQITYTLKIKNEGNSASLGNDTITDALDAATDYAGSLSATRYVAGVPSVASDVTLASSLNDFLKLHIANPIAQNDSITISFTVNVTSSPTLFNPPTCKKHISNTAFIYYNTSAGILKSESNASDCGVDSTTKISIIDPLVTGTQANNVGPINACSLATDTIIGQVRAQLLTAGVLPADVNAFVITDEKFSAVGSGDIFGLIAGSKKYFATHDLSVPGSCQEVYALEFACSTFDDVFIPNLITPGNDSYNNTFEIVGLIPNSNSKLHVFNSWGEGVYSSDNYMNDWQPKNNASGVYFFSFEDPIRKKEWKGWIQVINESK